MAELLHEAYGQALTLNVVEQLVNDAMRAA